MEKSKLLAHINKTLEYCYYSLFIVTPLIMTSITSELFEFNKMLFVYLTAVFILFLWLLKMILIKKIIIKKSYLDIPIWLFFLSQLISTFLSIDFHTSIFGYYGRFNGGLLSLGCYLIFYYALISNHQDFNKNYLERLLKGMLFGSLVVILWGLPGRFGYDLSCFLFNGQLNNSCWSAQFKPAERLFSTLGQPNWLGAYLAITFFIGLYYYFKTKGVKYWILNTGYLILNFVTLLFTRSRSSLMAVGIVFLLFIATYFFLSKKDSQKIIILGIFLLFFLAICKTGIPQIDRFFELKTYQVQKAAQPIKTAEKTTSVAPSLNSDVTESGDIRKIVWQGAIDVGRKYPFFGSGVETFAYAYYFVRPAAHNLTSEWDYLYNKAHNEYLNYFATTGFIGLATYLILILVVVIYGINKFKCQIPNLKTKSKNLNLKKNFQIEDLDLSSGILVLSLICGYITILITNFFGFSVTMINLFFYLIPGFIFMIGDVQERSPDNKIVNYSFNDTWQKISTTMIILFFLSSFIYILRYFLADINYAKGDNFYKTGNYQAAAGYLHQALKLKYEHVYEDKLSYILANLAFVSAYQKQEDSAKQLINLANFYNKKSLEASPQNSLYWKTKAKNYYLFYQITQNSTNIQVAVEALKKAKSLAPTDPKIAYSLSIFYSLLADSEKNNSFKKEFQKLAIKEAETAIKLKSNDQGYKQILEQLLKKYPFH